MPTSTYDLVIIGGSCAGLGLAEAASGSVLLIEPGPMLAADFVESMDPGTGWQQTAAQSGLARWLQNELRGRDALSERGVHLPALGALLYEHLAQSAIDYRFLCGVLNCRVEADGATLELHDRSGLWTVHARALVDTTSRCHSRPERHRGFESRRLHAALDRRDGEASTEQAGADWRIIPSHFPEGATLAVELPLTSDWPTARRLLHERVAELAAETPYRLASVAAELAGAPVQSAESDGCWRYLPSRAADNPLAAVDAGAALNASLLQETH